MFQARLWELRTGDIRSNILIDIARVSSIISTPQRHPKKLTFGTLIHKYLILISYVGITRNHHTEPSYKAITQGYHTKAIIHKHHV